MKEYQLPSPCYLLDEAAIRKNLEILKSVMDRTGCKILLAQKAFSVYACYPLIGQYLSGATASGLYEARLGAEEMGKENHIYCPGYQQKDFPEILSLCDHIIFNSFSQWEKFRAQAIAAGKECGIRINPEHSTQEHGIYDPCSAGSRMGVTLENFREDLLDGISGFHFHTLCEQNADALLETLDAVEKKFGKYFPRLKWLNFGGGHHITRADYDIESLVSAINRIRDTYGLQVYLEPGEAVVLNAGYLYAHVLDFVRNGEVCSAILDTSAACHMPDVLEVPYRPPVLGSGEAGEKPYTYRFGGPTCLAGDIVGDYSFDQPLREGDTVVFGDMALYTMVKNNTFNGMPLPAIAIRHENGDCELIREFGYEDFKGRLG